MEERNVPYHLAIILDGNGRWAKAKGMPRNYGHVQGAKVVEDMCEIVWNKGIHYFTVYAFQPKTGTDQTTKWTLSWVYFETI